MSNSETLKGVISDYLFNLIVTPPFAANRETNNTLARILLSGNVTVSRSLIVKGSKRANHSKGWDAKPLA